jgi:methyl-accepting chemotaxis protein
MLQRFQFTVGHKIYAIIALSFAVFLAILTLQFHELSRGLGEQKRVELMHLGELAISIVKEEYASAQSGAGSAAEAQQRAAKRVTALRYGDGDYFFISDMNLRMVAHPLRPELIGRDLSEFKDANGKRVYVEFTDAVKRSGKGFVSYDQIKPGIAKPQPKLSYVEGFAPWGWVVGTGVYVDALEQQVWDSARRALMIAAVALLLAAAVSMGLARRMSRGASRHNRGDGEAGVRRLGCGAARPAAPR